MRARRGDLPALAVAARQPAAGQRAVGQDAHAVAQAGREDVVLDRAGQDRVRRLLRAEALAASALGCPLRLDDLRRGDRRGAEGADLARVDEVGERAERLVDVGARIEAVDLVEVDPVGAQPAQRALDRLGDPAPRRAAAVGVFAHGQADFRGEHDVVAPPAGERLADDLLRLARGVEVGGVDEVDAGVERAVDDPDRVVVIGVAERAEHHRAEAQLTDRDAAASQRSMVH